MSKLISRRLFTKSSGKYSAALSLTYDEARECWRAVDELLKNTRKQKKASNDKKILAHREQLLKQCKKGLQECLEHLKHAEQSRIEGRWLKRLSLEDITKILDGENNVPE